MILFFNLEKLKKLGKDNPTTIINLLAEYYSSKKHKLMPKFPLRGRSWLLNPEPLFRDSADPAFKLQYLILAARRDYYLYQTYGKTTLILSYFPELDINKIKYNPLLKITDNEIYFKYEERNG